MQDGNGPAAVFRINPLLARFLYEELALRAPDLLTASHRAAASWFASAGQPADALRHALRAREWDLAAQLAEASWPRLLPGRRLRSVHPVAPVPPQDRLDQPWLLLAFAAERLDAADHASAVTYLNLVRRSRIELTGSPAEHLRKAVAAVRIVHAYQAGEPHAGLDVMRSVSGTIHPKDDLVHPFLLLAVGAANLTLVDLPAAESALTAASELARRAGLLRCRAAALGHLAALNAFRGALRTATRNVRELQTELTANDPVRDSALAWAEVALAEICRQRDQLRAAERHLERARYAGWVVDPVREYAVAFLQCRVLAARGDRHAAAGALATMRRQLTVGQVFPALFQLVALTEVEIRLSDVADSAAQAPAARQLLDELIPLPQLRPLATLQRARLSMVDRRPADAVALLLPELERARRSPALVVEGNLLCAEALAAHGDPAAATQRLDLALHVARDEGIRRPLDLRSAAGYGLLPETSPAEGAGPPSEPLTERETTVLRYLQSMLSTAEIASVLFVSVNTVKTHIKSIYRKLGTGTRRDAVRRAHELHLL
jgi:LuxR family transcriptional regulator, maltose regulon positive regulatory protein